LPPVWCLHSTRSGGLGDWVRSQSAKPPLVRIQYRGFSIEAVPFFSLDAAGWKAKAFVWRHAAEPVEQLVNDPTGATFSTHEHAVHASLFLGRNWLEGQSSAGSHGALVRILPHLGRGGEGRQRRRSAALVLGVLVGLLQPGWSTAQHLGTSARSVQRSYLTEQKNRVESPSHYEPIPFEAFLALPALPARYTASDWEIVRRHTQRGVSVEGYIAEVIAATDGATYGRPPAEGDFHLHLRATRQPECSPGGPRGAQLVTEVTPHFQPPKTGW